MKALMLVLAMSLATAATAQTVKREVDRFTRETELSIELDLNQRPNPYSVSPTKVIATARKNEGPVEYSALIATNSSIGRGGQGGWRYLNVDRIDWLVDGEPANFGKIAAQRQVVGRAVAEYFVQPFTNDDIALLASASTVEFRIGGDEFALSPEQIKAFRDLASEAAALEPQSSTE
jgi:hypothetical protein